MFDLIIFSLITWRVTHLITEENGPDDIFVKLREKGYIFTCFYCLSVWTGVAVALIFSQNLLFGLAYSALAIVINVLHDKYVL